MTNASAAHYVDLVDLDQDGDLDILSASYSDDTIAWYESDGAANPSWTAANIATSADGAYDVHVADMDGDGDLDIVSASKDDDTIAWYEHDGAADPSWTAANIATNADVALAVQVADMDGDGDLDIVSASQDDDTIAWYENDGAADPTWTAANIATSANGAFDVHVGDMDGDGDIDIISASSFDNTIAWYENTCDGSDPLVLDLDGDGVELLGLGSGVQFDVDADGVLETTGWVGPDDGLLAMDLDGSGQIEDMTEVFSEVFNGGNYTDSLAALATLDSNADQVISVEDDQFNEILVWQDSDSDGVSTETELATLTDHGISSLDLDATASDETVSDNTIDAVGTVEFDDATTGTFAEVTVVLDGAPTTFTLGGIISSGTEAVVEATEPEFFVVEPASDTPIEDSVDVAIAETVEEDPVETLVVTETVETASESEVSSDELWLKTPATDYSVYPATDTVEIAAQAESLAVAA